MLKLAGIFTITYELFVPKSVPIINSIELIAGQNVVSGTVNVTGYRILSRGNFVLLCVFVGYGDNNNQSSES